jgi:uncharacterized lipoprotein YajG
MKTALLAIPALLLLAGCQTTATTAKTVCAPWRAITYSGTKDTPQTVRQVRVHNATGKNVGCWK